MIVVAAAVAVVAPHNVWKLPRLSIHRFWSSQLKQIVAVLCRGIFDRKDLNFVLRHRVLVLNRKDFNLEDSATLDGRAP